MDDSILLEELIESAEESLLQEAVLEDREEKRSIADLPSQVFILPIGRRPFFPGMAAPLIFEPGPYYEVLKIIARSKHKSIGIFLTKQETLPLHAATVEDLYSVGVLARILRITPLDMGGAQVVLNIEERISIRKPIKNKYLRADIEYHEDEEELSKELKAYSINIITTIREILKLNPLFKEELKVFLSHSDFTEPGKLADFAVALTTATREELQEILSTFKLQERIDKALILLKKELDLSLLQNSINQKMEGVISKTQRDFFLREQLKAIKKELGIEKDDKTCDLEKYEARIKKLTIPQDVMTVITEEMNKLSVLEVQSAEYAVCRNYLDWLTIVPWGIYSKESNQLQKAQDILDEDHYGLKDIKERILEFISVGKLSGGVKGSIIALIGPPGVGKTSIGRSIARALGRQFYRFSVGGMRDEAEIKGHRRTYIGSMPGKMIQAFKFTQTMNPVVMLDEIDKIGSSYQGDPASALLEVLDPEQNREFLDHYLDVRCDLSNVLFIVTANVLDAIPEPLKDRMEILRLSGYILEEKLKIATKYLIPRNLGLMGLKSEEIKFSQSSLKQMVNGYAREAGVRSLENLIKKILRKIAVKKVRCEEKKEAEPFVQERIGERNLKEYLGKPIFTTDKFYDKTPVGVSLGLAWTSMGGATLYIEALAVSAEKSEIKLTGQTGDVMKESSQIAWSYVHSKAALYAPGIPFFEKSLVHLHIPEGATPKDGPSAGITMATALISLLKNQPLIQDLGMTGELTLTGKVLPIGGLKEKFIAAKRSGIKTIIFPKGNLRDYEELPENIKEGITVHYVSEYAEVYHVAFPQKELS